MLKLSVVGNPAFHSLSPKVYQIISNVNKIPLSYNRISAEKVEDAIEFAKTIKMNGLNITRPFKEVVIEHLDKIDYQATNLNSVNTVRIDGDILNGHNTDYFGILKTIWDNNIILNKKKVLILGVGAAGRTSAFAVRNLNAIIMVWDRNEEKAKYIAQEVGVHHITTKDLISNKFSFDIVVSSIPQNSSILQQIKWDASQTIIDTVYHNSFFVNNKSTFGFKVVVGENWLFNQATLSFEIFTSQKPVELHFKKEILNLEKNFSNSFVLIGFSGSGKSSLGKAVADKMGFQFYDTDVKISEQQGKSINEIFREHGEDYFRELETSILKEIQTRINSQKVNAIVATGGGIVEKPENIEIIKQIGMPIWIYAPIQDAFSRISNSNDRPLISELESAKLLFNSRINKYYTSSEGIFINNRDFKTGVARLESELKGIIK